MKITFLRLGHANNSSSSHSIIFTNEKIDSNESSEFGWDNFICSSKEDKTGYFLVTLWKAWRDKCSVDIGYGKEFYLETDQLVVELRNQFQKFVYKNFPWVKEVNFYPAPWDGYVDHQSRLTLPTNRITGFLDIDFCNAFFQKLINHDYAILGGNDNSDNSDDSDDRGPDIDSKHEQNDAIVLIYSFLQDKKNAQCLFDKLTEEWTISLESGPLLKFKF
jgi:hypothetical protein